MINNKVSEEVHTVEQNHQDNAIAENVVMNEYSKNNERNHFCKATVTQHGKEKNISNEENV